MARTPGAPDRMGVRRVTPLTLASESADGFAVTAVLPSSAERFEPALRWLDCMIEREVLRLRGRYELSLDELRGLYISDRQVDQLLQERLAPNGDADPVGALCERARELHAAYRAASPLAALGNRLGLSDEELDVVLLALAAEIDLRYEPLYGYLNNDIARKHLTTDLACRLLAQSRSGSELTAPDVRALFGAHSNLLRLGILEALPPGPDSSSLQHGYVLAPVVAQVLLALPVADPRWPREVRWLEPTSHGTDAEDPTPGTRARVFVLKGEDVEGLRAHATQIAHAHHWRLIGVTAAALARDPVLADRLRLVVRLVDAALLIDGTGEEHLGVAVRAVRDCAADGIPVILITASTAPVGESLADLPHLRTEIGAPTPAERAVRWTAALERAGLHIDAALVERLAESFALTHTRIDAVVQSVALRQPAADVRLALECEASARSNDGLARLATRIVRNHGWHDLVLSDNALQQLRAITQAIESRERVYRRWGLIERTGRSAGLMIFFTGAPGTGKTMAASVVANVARLELYRIDLASVVSKYIGETEKNLERIFAAAKRSSAILLFDEADALLGKRSEIKDAHDRYANIEVAYLLQKMEEHDGVVILSSNLAKNLDPAFARRMNYLLEFARPNATLRERLWRGMYPPRAPLSSDVDFRFLAERFETTGGEIQAIALDAAFLAAAARSSIGMAQLMRAMTRRQTKHGNPGGLERYREHREAVEAGGVRDGVV